jgi:hypothetical protein
VVATLNINNPEVYIQTNLHSTFTKRMAGADFCLKKAIEERANSWILDYAYYCTWEEFCSTKNIDIKTTRDFVQCKKM